MAFIEGCPHASGGLYEGFHCISFLTHYSGAGEESLGPRLRTLTVHPRTLLVK